MMFMGIGMLLFWGVLIVLAVLLVRGLFQSKQTTVNNQSSQAPTAKKTLELRYARGEITREQYQLMLKDLQ
jgi:putative membrane protein